MSKTEPAVLQSGRTAAEATVDLSKLDVISELSIILLFLFGI